MSSDRWALIVIAIIVVAVYAIVVDQFLKWRDKTRKSQRKDTLKNESDQQFIDDSYADESTHPPIDLRIDVPSFNHKHKLVFVGREGWNYAYICGRSIACDVKVWMNIKPMWGFIPAHHTSPQERLYLQNRAAFIREANSPLRLNPTTMLNMPGVTWTAEQTKKPVSKFDRWVETSNPDWPLPKGRGHHLHFTQDE